jgi:hypothetical protein
MRASIKARRRLNRIEDGMAKFFCVAKDSRAHLKISNFIMQSDNKGEIVKEKEDYDEIWEFEGEIDGNLKSFKFSCGF